MKTQAARSLSAHLDALLAKGRVTFDGEEAIAELGLAPGAFLDAAERLQRQGRLLKPKHGFYVVVPPQFRSYGAPPPPWYIDDLMRHAGRAYYVGLLKAAEMHGASHQAVMDFQVVADRQLPPLRVGRSAITFHYRKDIGAVVAGVGERKTEAGRVRVSSPELTALDLVRYPRASGGLDNAATVLDELADRLKPEALAALAPAFGRAVLQRLGHLLDRLGHPGAADPLRAALAAGDDWRWVELDPEEAGGDPDLASAPVERDARWRVLVRRAPEIDA